VTVMETSSSSVVKGIDRRLAEIDAQLADYQALVEEKERLIRAKEALLGEPAPTK
jgi:hypothetical protein